MDGHEPTNPPTPSQEETKEATGPAEANASAATNGQFEALLNQHGIADEQKFYSGALIKGTVVAIRDDAVVVDVGYKSEGAIPSSEFKDFSGNFNVKVGDEVDVLVEHMDLSTGHLRLSRRRAHQAKIWDDLEAAAADGRVMKGRVVEAVKGGLSVDLGGVLAFLPGSLVDVRKAGNLAGYAGRDVDVKIIKFNRRRGNVVVSRRDVMEAERNEQRRAVVEKLEIGKIIKGKIKNLTGYGAFVDLGGVDGLLHVGDMSWKRLKHPSEMFKVGDEVEVMVLSYNPETLKISLGYKQKTRDPWETAEETYVPGARVRGKVVSVSNFGAFVQMEDGVEGLIHVSEMSWTKKIRHAGQFLKEGDEVEAQVLKLDPEERRLSLGLRQLQANPWDDFSRTHMEGQRVKGKVKNLTEFGAFVELEDGIDGLIHISDMSWTERVKHPSEVVKKGQEVEAVIRGVDVENGRVSLSLKHLMPNAWDTFFATHRVGDTVKGKVTRLAEFGAFVEIEPGIEGLVHVSEISAERIEKPEQALSAGDELELKIIRVNPEEHKIGLSRRAIVAPHDMGGASEERYARPPRGGGEGRSPQRGGEGRGQGRPQRGGGEGRPPRRDGEGRGERRFQREGGFRAEGRGGEGRPPRREGGGRPRREDTTVSAPGQQDDGSIRLGDVIGKTLSSFIRARKEEEKPQPRPEEKVGE